MHAGTIVLLSEIEMHTTFHNPCIEGNLGASNSITQPVAIADMDYIINGHPAATTATVLFWRDAASTAYGYGTITIGNGNSQTNPYHICGAKTY